MANDGMDFLDELDFSDSNSKDAIEKIAGFLPGPLGQYLAKGSPKQRKIKCAFVSTICLVILLVILLIGVGVIVFIVSSSSSDDTTGDTTTPPPSDTTPPSPPPADATLPVIPKNFVTSYTSTIFFGEIPNVLSGTYMEDGDGGHRKIDYVAWLPGAFPDFPLNNSQVVNSDATFQVSNDVCRIIPVAYSNPFDWLEDDETYFAGYVTIDGVEYASWEQDDEDDEAGTVYKVVLLVNGNTPYLLNQTFTSDFFNFTETLTFGTDFQEATFNGTEWDIPSACYVEPICEPNPTGEIDELVFYRYHSAYDWQLENRNFGDLQGVATFLCWSYMFGYNTDPSLEVVSYYDLMVNTTWGEYGKCNLNYCAGSDDKTVGHAATGGFTANAGQCSTNDYVGNWYSLTNPTECSDGSSPDDGSCAWQLIGINQNITVDCLISSGFIDACLGNPIVPFPDAVALMQNGFATCPSVDASSFPSPPPSYTEEKSRKIVRSMMKEEEFPQKAVFSVAKELYSQLFGFY